MYTQMHNSVGTGITPADERQGRELMLRHEDDWPQAL